MPLINIVIALIVVGVALWLINTYIPMAGSIKTILNVVIVVAVAIWVLQAVGMPSSAARRVQRSRTANAKSAIRASRSTRPWHAKSPKRPA